MWRRINPIDIFKRKAIFSPRVMSSTLRTISVVVMRLSAGKFMDFLTKPLSPLLRINFLFAMYADFNLSSPSHGAGSPVDSKGKSPTSPLPVWWSTFWWIYRVFLFWNVLLHILHVGPVAFSRGDFPSSAWNLLWAFSSRLFDETCSHFLHFIPFPLFSELFLSFPVSKKNPQY